MNARCAYHYIGMCLGNFQRNHQEESSLFLTIRLYKSHYYAFFLNVVFNRNRMLQLLSFFCRKTFSQRRFRIALQRSYGSLCCCFHNFFRIIRR